MYTEKTRKLRQNTQKIAIFLHNYGKIHSKLPIFRVKSVKIYTGQKKFTRTCSWGSWQISGMDDHGDHNDHDDHDYNDDHDGHDDHGDQDR